MTRSSKTLLFGLIVSAAIRLASGQTPEANADASVDDETGACCKPIPLPAAAWDVLTDEVRNHRTSHRVVAVSALAVIGARADVVSLLKAALRDKDADVRKSAALALGELKVRSAMPELRAVLEDESTEVGFAAADALWKMGDRSGRRIFISTLEGERKGDGMVKDGLKSNLGKYRNPKVLMLTGAREAAGAFFGPLPIGFTIAEELLKDRTASARASSAALLAQDPSPEAVEQLKEALSDKNWAVRAAAAQALATSPGEVQLQVFEPILTDDHEAVRAIAAAGIVRRSGARRPIRLRWPTPTRTVMADVKQP